MRHFGIPVENIGKQAAVDLFTEAFTTIIESGLVSPAELVAQFDDGQQTTEQSTPSPQTLRLQIPSLAREIGRIGSGVPVPEGVRE